MSKTYNRREHRKEDHRNNDGGNVSRYTCWGYSGTGSYGPFRMSMSIFKGNFSSTREN